MNNAIVLEPSAPSLRVPTGVPGAPPRGRLAVVHPFATSHHAWPRSVLPSFERDVLAGLAQRQKAIASTWLYDHRGSELFEQITRVQEYYPTRNETQILRACAGEIADAAGRRAVVIELGSGSSRKTRLLLDALDAPQAYLPIDISEQYLNESAAQLSSLYPGLRVMPIVGDFTHLERLPELSLLQAAGADPGRRVVFFPGSTIGNFTPEQAVGLLRRVRRMAGPDALMIVGADSTQDQKVLMAAYDDRAGVTAEFNRNLLVRINRELSGTFDVDAFEHQARFDAQQHRVEMHLVSRRDQRVSVCGRVFAFAAGESIHTENSYKYSLMRFRQLANRAGWEPLQLWMDRQARIAVHVLEATTRTDACVQNVNFG